MAKLEQAQKILRISGAQLFTIEEVAEVVREKPAVIRNWISRGHIDLRFTELPGRGKRVLFAFEDIIQIMIVAEASRINIDPQISKRFAERVMSTVMRILMDFAGVFGEKHLEHSDNAMRYAIIYYSVYAQGVDVALSSSPTIELDYATDASRVVIDCKEIAERAISIISKFQKK